jgi:hypothetical protein
MSAGNNGELNSSSSATFTNQPTGGGNTITSSYNASSTSPYSVLSSQPPNPNSASNSATPLAIGTVGPASYSLGNVVSFALSAGSTTTPIRDQFTTSAVVTAAIPEPASMVMFLTGMPLPLVVVGLLRRRRPVAQG